MRSVWDATGWLDAGPGGAGWVVWLGNARFAANLVIVVASASVARSLLVLSRGRRSEPPAPRVLVAFAALIALGGVSHLVLLAGLAPAPVVPTVLKVAAAALWVVAAVRFRPAVTRLLNRAAAPAPAGLGHDPDELAVETERLKIKTRVLETLIHNETWLLDRADALRELREILADLEASRCKI
jgi:hypothetical protein